ncbi:MAG: AAA family ATPase [Planctomycetia bacterium]|nr:AAA family ATPase [Planctomycetia bacterium]
MMTEYFQRKKRPFSAEPKEESYCKASPLEKVRRTVLRCVERGEGISLIIGGAGTGKTLLCRVLANDFQETRSVVILNGNSVQTSRALFQTLLSQLGFPYVSQSETELRLAFSQYLSQPEYSPSGVVLIVDDAQGLRMRLFEELRLLADAVFSFREGVRLVLAGTSALEEKLAHPKLSVFSQRITTHGFLESFTRDETVTFLQEQFRQAGGDVESVFPEAVCREIHRQTDGIPRVVNQLADHLLWLAAQKKWERLTPECVPIAWRSLQHFSDSENTFSLNDSANDSTTPMKPTDEKTSFIEFGTLDDEQVEQEEKESSVLDTVDSSDLSDSSIGFELPENGENEEEGTLLWTRDEEEIARQTVAETTAIPECWSMETAKNQENTLSAELAEKGPSETLTIEELGELYCEPGGEKDALEKEEENLSGNGERWKDAYSSPNHTASTLKSPVIPPRHPAFSVGESRIKSFRRNGLLPEPTFHEATERTNRVLCQAYLEETVQSLARLHRIMEALSKEAEDLRLSGNPSSWWRNLHDLGASTLGKIMQERFSEPPVENSSWKLPIQAKDMLEAGGTSVEMLPDSHYREDVAHPLSESHLAADETLEKELIDLDVLHQRLSEKLSCGDAGPELKKRLSDICQMLKALDCQNEQDGL